jgi:hypothetical protein
MGRSLHHQRSRHVRPDASPHPPRSGYRHSVSSGSGHGGPSMTEFALGRTRNPSQKLTRLAAAQKLPWGVESRLGGVGEEKGWGRPSEAQLRRVSRLSGCAPHERIDSRGRSPARSIIAVWWEEGEERREEHKTDVSVITGARGADGSAAAGSVRWKPHDRFPLSGMFIIPTMWESYIP